MKKSIIFIFFSIVVFSCKTTSVVNTKLDTKKEQMLKGNWAIASVSFPGDKYLKVNSFNIEDSNCFVGSNWSFVSNNNKGEMSLNSTSANCKDFTSPITWYINKEGNFVLKIINDYKAKEVNNGFVLKINNITETSFDLVDEISVGGQLKSITYNFQKK